MNEEQISGLTRGQELVQKIYGYEVGHDIEEMSRTANELHELQLTDTDLAQFTPSEVFRVGTLLGGDMLYEEGEEPEWLAELAMRMMNIGLKTALEKNASLDNYKEDFMQLGNRVGIGDSVLGQEQYDEIEKLFGEKIDPRAGMEAQRGMNIATTTINLGKDKTEE